MTLPENLSMQELNAQIIDAHLLLLALWQEKLTRSTDGLIPIDQSLTNCIEISMGITDQEAQCDKVKEEARGIIRDILIASGNTEAHTNAGTVTYTTTAPIVTYDRDALEALCLSDTYLAKKLYPHRIVREGTQRLTIKRQR